MKKVIFLTIFFTIWSANAQISIHENFEESDAIPEGWTTESYLVFSGSEYYCEGVKSVIHNLYSSSPTGYITAPTQTSTGDDIQILYSWSARPYSTNLVDYSVYVEYTTDGETWVLISEYDVVEETSCTTLEATISGTDVPSGSNFTFRIRDTWNSGDSYHSIDDIHITQLDTTSIADATIDGLKIFPNPVENLLTITATDSITAISIINILGQKVLHDTPTTNRVQLNISDLLTGAYVVKIEVGDVVASYPLIKE